MVLFLLIASLAAVRCRPQDFDSSITSFSRPQGTFIGEIIVSSPNVAVKNKKKKTTTTPKPESSDGPGFLRFIGGPDSELIFGAPEAEVAVASGAGLSISDSTITFNNPAQVVPISSK